MHVGGPPAGLDDPCGAVQGVENIGGGLPFGVGDLVDIAGQIIAVLGIHFFAVIARRRLVGTVEASRQVGMLIGPG